MKDALCFHEPTEGIPFRLDSYYSGLHLLEKIYFLLREQERNGDVLAGKFLSFQGVGTNVHTKTRVDGDAARQWVGACSKARSLFCQEDKAAVCLI